MSSKAHQKKDGVVDLPTFDPSPDRILAVKAWHLEQATKPQLVVASLSIQVTADGQIGSTCIGMDASMAEAALLEIDAVRARLEQFIAQQARAAGAKARVIPLRRCA